MTSLRDAYVDFIRTGFCTIASGAIGAQELFYQVFREFPDVRPYNVLGGLYSQFCNRPPPPTLDIPRRLGQCAVKYRVNASGTVRTGTGPIQNWTGALYGCSNTPDVLYGPISGPFIAPDATNTQIIVYFIGKNGQGQTVQGNVQSFPRNNGQTVVTVTSSLIQRCDNQPDLCGGFIPPQNPPGSTHYNDNRTYINNNGDVTNVNLDLTIPLVYINADAELEFVANINADFNGTANIDIPVRVNVSTGDFHFNVGDDVGDNRPGEDDTDYDTPDSPDPEPIPDPDIPDPNDDDTDDSGEPGRLVIRGVFVVLTSVDQEVVGTIYQQNTPTILIPCGGYVSFLIKSGNSVGWTSEIPVKSSRAFIPCPWEGGAVNVRFSPRGRTIGRITPLFKRSQPPPPV